jgi:hypothetical protein
MGIIIIVEALPLSIHWGHVKGHQDDVIPLHQLTRMDKPNILADKQATI